MRGNLLTLVATTLLAGCAAHDEVRFVQDTDPPLLEFRQKGQLGWNDVEVRRADGVPPPRFAVAPPCATLGWTDGEPAPLSVALDDKLVLSAGGRPLFLGDGEAVLLLPGGLALRLGRTDEQPAHERYVGRTPEGQLVEVDVWFAAGVGDAALSVRLDGAPAIPAPAPPEERASAVTSHARFADGRPTQLETAAPGLELRVTLDAVPPTAELRLGEASAVRVTLERQP